MGTGAFAKEQRKSGYGAEVRRRWLGTRRGLIYSQRTYRFRITSSRRAETSGAQGSIAALSSAPLSAGIGGRTLRAAN